MISSILRFVLRRLMRTARRLKVFKNQTWTDKGYYIQSESFRLCSFFRYNSIHHPLEVCCLSLYHVYSKRFFDSAKVLHYISLSSCELAMSSYAVQLRKASLNCYCGNAVRIHIAHVAQLYLA